MDRPIDVTSTSDASPQMAPSQPLPFGVCQFCNCTDERACKPPCYWINDEHTICSAPPCMDQYFGRLAETMRRALHLARAGAI